MENQQEQNGFKLTYSAREQAELKRLREKYMPRETGAEEDKMARLLKLDRGVAQKALAVSLILGILGVLILGLGMSLVMTELGQYFGLDQTLSMIVGIIIGVVGMIPTALAYPVYQLVLKNERKRVAPEILRLTDELIK